MKLRLVYFDEGVINFDWDLVWLNKVPSKVKIFVWLVIRNRVLTMENLQRRGIRFAGKCILCGHESEDSEHLFNGCSFSTVIWGYFCHWGKHRELLYTNVQNRLVSWSVPNFSERGVCLWKVLFHSNLWSIWKERKF